MRIEHRTTVLAQYEAGRSRGLAYHPRIWPAYAPVGSRYALRSSPGLAGLAHIIAIKYLSIYFKDKSIKGYVQMCDAYAQFKS